MAFARAIVPRYGTPQSGAARPRGARAARDNLGSRTHRRARNRVHTAAHGRTRNGSNPCIQDRIFPNTRTGNQTLLILALRLLRIRSVSVAHDLAEIEPHVVRNFTPAFPSSELCYDAVEALTGGFGQQVRSFQLAIAESCRCLLRLKRVHRNAGLAGNPVQHLRATRRIGAVRFPFACVPRFSLVAVRIGIDHFFFGARGLKQSLASVGPATRGVARRRSAIGASIEAGIIARAESGTALSRLSPGAARGRLSKLAPLRAGIIL